MESMKIRTIKPEWLDDERLASCSDAARLLSVALITLADDAGRGRLGIITAARVFPTDPGKFDAAFAELEGWYVSRYVVRGQSYFTICNFARHQVLNPKRFRVLTPEPPDTDRATTMQRPCIDRATTDHGPCTDHATTVRDRDRDRDRDQVSYSGDLRSPTYSLTSPERGEKAGATKADVRKLFEHWRTTTGRNGKTVLTADRERRLRKALKDYGMEMCWQAVQGAMLSDFHRGENDRGVPYLDVQHVFKPENVERFVGYLTNPPKKQKSALEIEIEEKLRRSK